MAGEKNIMLFRGLSFGFLEFLIVQREPSVDKWDLIHAYRRAADEGLVKHLSCPDDDEKLVSRIGPDDEPVLWCWKCNTVTTPGLHVYDEIRRVLDNLEK